MREEVKVEVKSKDCCPPFPLPLPFWIKGKHGANPRLVDQSGGFGISSMLQFKCPS